MPEIKKIKKAEMLILIYNETIRDLCLAEVNVAVLEYQHQTTLVVGANPEATQALTKWRDTVQHATRLLEIIDGLIRVALRHDTIKKEAQP